MKRSEAIFESYYAVPSRNGIYKSKEFHGRGCRMVNMGELFGYDFISSQEMKRVELTDEEIATNGLQDGDLLFGRRSLVEAGAGKCSIVIEPSEPLTFESSIIRVRLDKKAVNPLYFYYYFRSRQGRGRIRSIVSGTNVKGIRGSDLKRLPVEAPKKNVQDEIADVLSAYDKLIENNRRRMELLERAARLLYEEWFVHLRFPGHEHIKVSNGIPHGWERKELSEVCAEGDGIQTGPFGSQLHQSDYADEGVPVVMPQDIINFRISTDHIARIPEDLANRLGRHRMQENDIVYGRRGDIGRRAFISRRQSGWFCGTGSLRLRPNPQAVNPRYLFDLLGSPETAQTIAGRAKGSTMPNLSTGILKSIPLALAPRTLQNNYVELVQPMSEMVETLAEQNQKLRTARDLLLPRLMSGEITV